MNNPQGAARWDGAGDAATPPPEPPADGENVVLIFAPYGQDAALLASALDGNPGDPPLKTYCAVSAADFVSRLPAAALGVLTVEALTPAGLSQIQAALAEQPPWSDIPLIVLTKRMDAASYALLANALDNVTIIGRPLDSASFLTIVRTAFRARNRQYQVRDLVHAAESQNAQILALNERLSRAMTETHHRVKNNLQLIVAFITLLITEGEDAIPAAQIARINAQVRTLAAVHDILTNNTKEGGTGDTISARALLEKLLGMMESVTERKRLTYRVEDALLPSHQGTSLALVANELALNALKHCRSAIDVTMTVNGQTALLTVSDDGAGLPDGFSVEESSNTGLALVENLTRWDLEGETFYQNRTDGPGAKIEISFPLPAK